MKKCEFCKKEFLVKPNTKGRFCGYRCYWEDLKGKRISTKTEFKKGFKPWNTGLAKKFNCITCKVEFENKSHGKPKYCSEVCKKYGEWGKVVGTWNKNRPKEVFSRMGLKSVASQDRINRPTSIEKIVYDFLIEKGVIFERQKIINGKFSVDVYIPSENLVIECDGTYWHSLEKNIKRDKAKNAYLITCGYKLLRLKESEIKNNDFIQILERRVSL